jgi:hypothetical protein
MPIQPRILPLQIFQRLRVLHEIIDIPTEFLLEISDRLTVIYVGMAAISIQAVTRSHANLYGSPAAIVV